MIQSPPFSISGIDHFGPLYCSDFSKKKFYVLLFTVELYVLYTLNWCTFDSLLAMRRFISRRGLPTEIYSDNSKTFKALKEKNIVHLRSHVSKMEVYCSKISLVGRVLGASGKIYQKCYKKDLMF